MMNAVTNIDPLDLIRTLWRRKFTIVACGLIGAALAIAVCMTLTKKYEASGNLVVRSSAIQATDSDAAFAASAVNEAVVTTEQEVLTSPGLLQRVADQVSIPPAFLDRRSFGQKLVSAAETLASFAGPSMQQTVAARLDGLFPEMPTTEQSMAEKRLQFVTSSLKISSNKNSSVVTVRAVTPNPQLSTDIVNSVLHFYMEDRIAEQSRNARLIEAALRDRLRQIKQQIDQGEERITTLLRQPGAIESDIPGEKRDLTLLSNQLTEARAELARRQSDLNSAMQLRGGKLSDTLPGGATADLRARLADLQARQSNLAGTVGANHPSRVAIDHEIDAVRGEIAREANRGLDQRRTDLAQAQAAVAALQQQLDSLRNTRRAEAPATIDLQRQRQSVASLWKIADDLETRLVDLASRPANPNARILSVAVIPTQAAFPSKSLFGAAGFLMAALLASLTTLVLGHLRGMRPAAAQLARQFDVPLLGGLPQLPGTRTAQNRLLGSALGSQSQDGLAETLHGVALEVEDAVRQGAIRCLMVTSGRSGEGKTTVSAALARSLAGNGIRILLFDLDMRHPSTEEAFAASAPGALQDYEQALGPERSIHVKVDRHTGMHLLRPSPEDSQEPLRYLRSRELQDMLDQARQAYDLVLFDTPPVLAVPDPLLAARLADSILLVTELGRNDPAASQELSRRLERTHKPICGVIVTKVANTSADGAYTGYPKQKNALSLFRPQQDARYRPGAQQGTQQGTPQVSHAPH